MARLEVDQERWEQAQAWEYRVWYSHNKGGRARRLLNRLGLGWVGAARRYDDWNEWWKHHFEAYRFLPNHLGEFLELGCGPYTNARIVLLGRTAQRVTLSDPLALRYAAFKRGWLAEQYRARRVLVDDHCIEEAPWRDATFDVVLMNNVLDHVRDAPLCLRQAARILKPGGYFLLGQDLTNEEDEKHHEQEPEDIGHPIRLSMGALEPLLHSFEPVLKKVLPREAGRAPQHHSGTLIYAGRKKS